MNSSTERAVERLTQAHTEVVEGHVTEWQPLLFWIRERVTEINRRGGGAGGQGLPLNNDALEVLNYIKKRLKLMCEAAHLKPTGSTIKDTRKVWETVQADWQGGRMDETAWEAVCDEFPDWVHRIELEQDRPRKMELTVPCPRCEKRWVMDDQDRRVAAVVVEFAEGRAPVAECRVEDCGAMWAGWADVARLGFTVGAAQNQEILTACGIDTPNLLGTTTV